MMDPQFQEEKGNKNLSIHNNNNHEILSAAAYLSTIITTRGFVVEHL